MTWKTFIDVIRSSLITNDVPFKIVINLFNAGKCRKEFSESTANSWYYGTRNCNANRYFPDGNVDYNGLFNFFRKRPDAKVRKLQQEFYTKIDADSPIDVDTPDMDVFCWSLTNQVLDLLGFQRVDIPSGSNSTENDLVVSSPEMVGVGNEAVGQSQTPATDDDSGAQLHIEDKYKCCRFCVNWNGTMQSKFAICSGYQEPRKSTEGKECLYFEPNRSRITVESLKKSCRGC